MTVVYGTGIARSDHGRIRRVARRTGVGCAGILLLCIALTDAVSAQCALRVTAQPGETGYRKRDYGCEGLYVQLQAASINVQVISLVKGGLTFDASDVVEIHVPPQLPGLRDSVAIFGRGREANLNWALDWFARPGRPMTWRLGHVVRQIRIDAARLGVFGQTVKASGLGAPVHVPVAVRPPGVSPVPRDATIDFVIRIPLAGAAQWRLGPAAEWVAARPYNGDGFFAFALPAHLSGENDFEIRWSPRGKREYGAPESLRIFFW